MQLTQDMQTFPNTDSQSFWGETIYVFTQILSKQMQNLETEQQQQQ